MQAARQPIFNNVPPAPLFLAVSFVIVFALDALVPGLHRLFRVWAGNTRARWGHGRPMSFTFSCMAA